MNRRTFLRESSLASIGLAAPALPALPAFSPAPGIGIVVHSYALRWNSTITSDQYPGFGNALDLIRHCKEIGAVGVQVLVKGWTTEFAKSVRILCEQLGMYVEGSIGMPASIADVAQFEMEVKNAKVAGMRVLRTVCSAGRRYENYHSMEAFQQLQKNALVSLHSAEPILRQQKMKLAVENHKDWRATELKGMLQQLNSEWVGVTLDFGNSISLLEDPMEVTHTLVPFVFSTHVKDMGVEEYEDGFLLSEVPLGRGILDLPAIIALCREHNRDVTFNLEMITRDPLKIPCLKKEYWETFADLPATELARTLRMVRSSHTSSPLPRISTLPIGEQLAAEEQNILDSIASSKKMAEFK